MKVSNFSLAIAAALVVLGATPALADHPQGPVTVSVSSTAGSGRISTQTSTYAAVNGTGDSISHAATQAGAYTSGSAVAGSGSIGINGAVNGYVDAQAYNVKTGAGTGSASAGGWSDASWTGSALLNIQGVGGVQGVASIDGGMTNAVRNGVDAHVVAGTAQDGYSGGTYAGTVSLSGNVNGVASTQTADGEAFAGRITFTGTPPVGEHAAAVSANSGVDTSVSGAFNNTSASPMSHDHHGE